jgi:ribosomal protein L2
MFKLYHIRRLTKISMLELTPGKGVQYVLSSGCSAKILRFNYKQHAALLLLPSGVKKIFSIHVIVLRRPIALKKKKRKTFNTKSGY